MTSKSESSSTAVTARDKPKSKPKPQASISETLSFVFECGTGTSIIWFIGILGGLGNGAVYPILAYLFSHSFSSISGASTDGLHLVRTLAYKFMVVGAFAFAMATIQTACFEIVAYRASKRLRMDWFHALLRQDPSFFDVHDIGGIASNVGPSANRYRRGVGRKFGEGVQFFTTGVGGLIYALFASWRVALVVMAVIPFVSVSALMVVRFNQTKSSRAAIAYSKAGSIAYSTVSAIKTVFSLNAIPRMIEKYGEATQEAFKNATSVLCKQGFANGKEEAWKRRRKYYVQSKTHLHLRTFVPQVLCWVLSFACTLSYVCTVPRSSIKMLSTTGVIQVQECLATSLVRTAVQTYLVPCWALRLQRKEFLRLAISLKPSLMLVLQSALRFKRSTVNPERHRKL